MGIAVAPDNPDVIYVANTTTWKSSDAGKTFVGFRGAPGGDDYQRIWISSEHPQTIALSSDQGAVITVNGGPHGAPGITADRAVLSRDHGQSPFRTGFNGAQQESGSIGTMSRSDYGEITFASGILWASSSTDISRSIRWTPIFCMARALRVQIRP